MKKFQRRILLRGLGGAAVVAPFLKSVAERTARAEDLADVATPKRLIVLFTHYGCITTRWFPENSHGPLTAADFAGTTLEALGPMAHKLLLPRGIRAMNEWTDDASLGQGNGPHINVVGSYFTCVPITPHEANPFALDNEAATLNAMPTAPSLDHVCAQQVSPGGVPLFLRVGDRPSSSMGQISYAAAEEPFPGIGALREIIQRLTGVLGGGPISPATYRAAAGKSVLDLVQHDLETLERFDMSRADRDKLAAWKELLHETTGQVSRQCPLERLEQLGLTEDNVNTSPSLGDIAAEVANGLDTADLYSNAAVLAALCDLNPVIFLAYPEDYVFRSLGLDQEIDSLNHRVNGTQIGGDCRPGVTEDLLTVDRFYAAKFAHLIGQLDSFDEGDGTLLDNTATVWFHETSDGCAMNLNNMPIIQAGGCGGYFKTGQAVNVFDGASDLHRGNSETPCTGEGTIGDIKDLGTPVGIAEAPINKYYCTLMNAIGVKAGPDGFPLVGGEAEVTHYGMYDNTRDFASGGANPPLINDPGEFAQLRA